MNNLCEMSPSTTSDDLQMIDLSISELPNGTLESDSDFHLEETGWLITNPVELKELALMIINFSTEPERYIVLGGAGNEFSIDVCTGPMATRTTVQSIYIDLFSTYMPCSITRPTSPTIEVVAVLPDASYLIALLFLITGAMRCELTVTHPVDKLGNTLNKWDEVVKSVFDVCV